MLLVTGLCVGIIYWRDRHRQINKPWAASPCPAGLVSVDNTIQPLLKIGVLETNCENDIASVHFNVTNVGSVPNKHFCVRAIYTYDTDVEDGAENCSGPLAIGQTMDSYVGMGIPSQNGKSVGRLHKIALITSSLELPDGTKWRRPSIHELTSK